EVDDLVEDARGVAPPAERVEALGDPAETLGAVRLDACLAQRLGVPPDRRDLDHAACEAASVGDTAARRDRHLDRLRVEERADPADGPRETESALVPAHGAREREAAHELLEPLR